MPFWIVFFAGSPFSPFPKYLTTNLDSPVSPRGAAVNALRLQGWYLFVLLLHLGSSLAPSGSFLNQVGSLLVLFSLHVGLIIRLRFRSFSISIAYAQPFSHSSSLNDGSLPCRFENSKLCRLSHGEGEPRKRPC